MANSKSVASSSSATSDEFSIAAGTILAELFVKAENDGAPASGDIMTVKLLSTLGDPDADPDSADEFTTVGQGEVLGVFNTNAEDPQVSPPRSVSPLITGGKLHAQNDASSNGITVSAQLAEMDSSGTKTYTQITWT